MHQGDEEKIRRKAYEIWESEGRPEGRHADHWRRARESFRQDKRAAEISGETSATAAPGDLHEQDKAMIPQNGAQVLTQTAQPEPGSEPTPPAKRPRTQRRKTSPT